MKTVKSRKRHALIRPRKAVAREGHPVGRKRSIARQHVHAHHVQGNGSNPHASPKTGYKGFSSPVLEKPKVDVEYQAAIRNFEIAVRAFQKQNYDKAAEIFEKLLNGKARDVAERAQMHLRLCRQRTGRSTPHPKSADEYYTLGVACLNAREFGLAIEHLGKAAKMKPNQDHVHYALAVSHTLEGNADAAIAHLETAFVLRPENRIHARREEDFQGLANDPRFQRLMSPAGI